MTPERQAELREALARMDAASSVFYRHAVHTGHHAFVEFTGLLNEYIKVCRRSLDEDGVDFTGASTHSGKALRFEGYELAYIAEKLECIFGPVLADKRLRAAFFGDADGAT